MLRRVHGVLLHAAWRQQLRMPAAHVRRRLVAVQLRQGRPLRDDQHALLPGLFDGPGRGVPGRLPLREPELCELQDLLRGVPVRELQHADPARHTDPVPARDVCDPVPDRLSQLQL